MAQRRKKNPSLLEFAIDESAKPPDMVEYRALIEWHDGIPQLVSKPECLSLDPAEAIPALLRVCLGLPYDGLDPSLKGLTCEEAMIVNLVRDASQGSSEARDVVLDRLLGRPKQSVESVSLTGNLNDFLDKVAQETQTEKVTITVKSARQEVEDL